MEAVEKLVNFAVAKEEESAAFYDFLSSAARRPHLRQVFEEFARQERSHKKSFEKIIKEGCRVPMKRDGASRDMRLSDYLVEIPFDPQMSYQDALILGMKREEKSAAFYLDLARKVEDACLAETIGKLAGEEARHKRKLEELYEKEIMTED
jgi:rubrerythrin